MLSWILLSLHYVHVAHGYATWLQGVLETFLVVCRQCR